MNPKLTQTIQEMINNHENTMDAYIARSVCVLLITLESRHHLDKRTLLKLGNEEVQKERQENFFKENMLKFKEKLEEYSKELGIKEIERIKVINFIYTRLNEPVTSNSFDTISYYRNGIEKQDLTVSLKVTFALVIAEMFNDKDPYNRPDNGEEWKNGLKNRVEVLYLCWKELYADATEADKHLRCHQGVRHLLALTLCNFNPLADDLIITHFGSFLEKQAAEYLVGVFSKIESKQKLKYIFNIIKNKEANNDPVYTKELASLASGLKEHLIKACARRGVNIQEIKTLDAIAFAITSALERKDFFETIPEIALPAHNMRELIKLLRNNPDSTDLVIKKARQIFAECQTFDDLADKGLVVLLEINKIEQYLQEFLSIVACYRQDSEGRRLEAEANKWLQQIEQYRNDFVSGNVYDQLLLKKQQEIASFKEQVEKFKNDKSISDVTNFFALFNSTNDIQIRTQLSQAIAEKRFIIFGNDEELTQEFLRNQDTDAVFLTPYQINLILLHAIITPLDQCRLENFSKYFNLVLDFLQELPAEDTLAGNLKESSYPEKLLNTLKILDPKYNNLESIKNADLNLLFQLLPKENQAIVLGRIGQLATNAKNFSIDDLLGLLRGLSGQNQAALIQQIGIECIGDLVKTAEDCAKLFGCVQWESQAELIQEIGVARMGRLIITAEDFFGLFRCLSQESQSELLRGGLILLV